MQAGELVTSAHLGFACAHCPGYAELSTVWVRASMLGNHAKEYAIIMLGNHAKYYAIIMAIIERSHK